jgi:NADPH-dependent ferric siderophore reductase
LESREYTPAAAASNLLTVDFVLHGEGPGSKWAAGAKPGDEVWIGGPRGTMVVDGEPHWWLLAGDLTALPAIRRFAARVPQGVPVDVYLTSDDKADEQEITSLGDLSVTWVRSVDGNPSALIAALEESPRHEGDGFAFIAAESSAVRPARALLAERGIGADHCVVKGYWKRSVSDFHDHTH